MPCQSVGVRNRFCSIAVQHPSLRVMLQCHRRSCRPCRCLRHLDVLRSVVDVRQYRRSEPPRDDLVIELNVPRHTLPQQLHLRIAVRFLPGNNEILRCSYRQISLDVRHQRQRPSALLRFCAILKDGFASIWVRDCISDVNRIRFQVDVLPPQAQHFLLTHRVKRLNAHVISVILVSDVPQVFYDVSHLFDRIRLRRLAFLAANAERVGFQWFFADDILIDCIA